MVRDDAALSPDCSCSRDLSWLWRSVTLRTEERGQELRRRNTDGFQAQTWVLLTQPGVRLVLLSQVGHVILKLYLPGQEILLELLEEKQSSDGLWR